MVKAHSSGKMARHMKENGCKEPSMALVSGKLHQLKTVRTSVNGSTTRYMATACINGRMETSMKVNGKMALKAAKALICLQTATVT